MLSLPIGEDVEVEYQGKGYWTDLWGQTVANGVHVVAGC